MNTGAVNVSTVPRGRLGLLLAMLVAVASQASEIRFADGPEAAFGGIGFQNAEAELAVLMPDDFRDKTPVRPPDRAAAIQALLDDRSVGLKSENRGACPPSRGRAAGLSPFFIEGARSR